MPSTGKSTEQEPFRPEDFGFFRRRDWSPEGIEFYEKDHESIDKSREKDWERLNLYLTRSDNFTCIWYGVIDPIVADVAYEEKYGFTWSDGNREESLFRGYIENRFEAEIILEAIRMNRFSPQYLG